MPTVEWQIPYEIVSPQGTLYLNQDADGPGGTSGFRYLLDGTKCAIGPATIRTTTDDVPQADGGIVHRAFKSLMLAKFGLELWSGDAAADAVPACADDLRAMWDRLMLHVEALVKPSQTALDNGNCRIRWSPSYPSGSHDRILDRVQMLQWPVPTYDGVVTSVDLTFQSPYPYAIDLTQTTPTLNATVTNAGNCAFYPVFRIYGFANFTLTNVTTGLKIVYNDTLPGAIIVPAGHYAEIDTFRNTIYYDGNSTNLKPGIDVMQSDFFPLIPGPNVLTITPTVDSAVVLANNAWA